jgi:hypothetical protein
MLPQLFDEVVDRIVSKLSYRDKDRILKNMVWSLFGEVTPDGADIFLINRDPGTSDIINAIEGLRQDISEILIAP